MRSFLICCISAAVGAVFVSGTVVVGAAVVGAVVVAVLVVGAHGVPHHKQQNTIPQYTGTL